MADTFYGVNATKSRNVPVDMIPPGEVGGAVLVACDTYALTTDVFAVGDVIKMCKIPSGAKIISVHFISPDLGGASTCDIGYVGAATAIVSNLDISGQAVDNMYHTNIDLSAEAEMLITMDGTTATDTGTIKMVVQYVLV